MPVNSTSLFAVFRVPCLKIVSRVPFTSTNLYPIGPVIGLPVFATILNLA